MSDDGGHEIKKRFGELMNGDRLGRYSLITQTAFVVGFTLGGYMPARRAAYQFYAEHQHCLPQTRAEAMLYYRTRNYRIIHAFMASGFMKGLQMGAISASYCVFDLIADYVLLERSLLMVKEVAVGSVTGSMLAFAGKGHRVYYAVRGARLGGVFGLFLGCINFLNKQYGITN